MTTTTLDQAPRYSKDDKVRIVGSGAEGICTVEAVLPASRLQPIGYDVRRPSGRRRAYREDQLEPAGDQ